VATTNAHQTKSSKQELVELLEKKPKIYKDAVKWTLARWSGISFSLLFEDLKSQAERENMLRELRNDDCFRVIKEPEEGSEAIIQVTEKGRDLIIGLFYSKSEQKELKSLLKKFDGALAQKTTSQPKT